MIECNNICKTYRRGNNFSRGSEVEALKNVSFAMQAGRSLGLLGENGSGKSTLTRILLGLERPTSGTVRFDGKDIHEMVANGDIDFRRHIQAVFQDPASAMNPRWSAFKVISEPLVNFGVYKKEELREKVRELMLTVELDPCEMDKNTTRFSGGQQQRICIACALALNPEVLILDEAVSSLDMLIQLQIVELLERLKIEQNLSLLLISHDIRAVFKLCENIVVLSKGEIVDRLDISGIGSCERKSDALVRLIEGVSICSRANNFRNYNNMAQTILSVA